MTRRKGETTGRINERDYPNIVELPVPSDGFRDKSVAMVAFHRERGIEIKHGRGRHHEGRSLCATVLRTRPWPMHSNISSAASAEISGATTDIGQASSGVSERLRERQT
jgi:hypothetical protein